jgi:hypothetical protein
MKLGPPDETAVREAAFDNMCHIATDYRKYAGLYFVRSSALQMMKEFDDIPEALEFLEELSGKDKTSTDPGWAGYVPLEQHFGTSPSYSPVGNLKYAAGAAIMAMKMRSFNARLDATERPSRPVLPMPRR